MFQVSVEFSCGGATNEPFHHATNFYHMSIDVESSRLPMYICETCGTQYAESRTKPSACRICTDDRQYVGWDGQKWTTLKKMKSERYRNVITKLEPRLYQIITKPEFGIGQCAFLLQTDEGNVLWECLTFINERTIRALKRLGPLRAIAISHPHYYSSMVEWAEKFDVQVDLSKNDGRWVVRPSPRLHFWSGTELELFGGVKLLCLGGHFEGSSVLLWPQGDKGKGVILAGDTISVASDRRYVSFMYSYPNLIPLSSSIVTGIANAVLQHKFDRIYASFEGRVVKEKAMESVRSSADRYVAHLS